MEDTNHLNSLELGTKAYWDKSYSKEIKNYQSHGDPGEIWFDESSQYRIVIFLQYSGDFNKEDSIIDLGTGNGMMLMALAHEGYTNLTGVDYSEEAIALASKIAKNRKHNITFKVADLLSEESIKELGRFKICLDKGTYDAISLMENAKEMREEYKKSVSSLMTDDGFFVITSCNFTGFELAKSFKGTFDDHTTIPTPVFSFGGKTGMTVTTMIFKKHL